MNYAVSCFNTPNHGTYIGLTPKRLGNYVTCLFTIKILIGKYHCRTSVSNREMGRIARRMATRKSIRIAMSIDIYNYDISAKYQTFRVPIRFG